jgi:DNA invertase Pin-like site-specific DNA recombinase
MKNFIALIRVSTTMQSETRNGLDGQRADITRWAAVNGYNIVTFLEEVASGGLPIYQRPVLQKAIEMAKKLKAKIVVSKIDRCSRVEDISKYLMKDLKIVIAADLGENVDPFISTIFAGMAEKERAMISSRTKSGLAAAKARGVVLGNKTNLDVATVLATEARIEKADCFAETKRDLIESLWKSGHNFSKIASILNSNGVRTIRGGEWYATSVARMIDRLKIS